MFNNVFFTAIFINYYEFHDFLPQKREERVALAGQSWCSDPLENPAKQEYSVLISERVLNINESIRKIE